MRFLSSTWSINRSENSSVFYDNSVRYDDCRSKISISSFFVRFLSSTWSINRSENIHQCSKSLWFSLNTIITTESNYHDYSIPPTRYTCSEIIGHWKFYFRILLAMAKNRRSQFSSLYFNIKYLTQPYSVLKGWTTILSPQS